MVRSRQLAAAPGAAPAAGERPAWWEVLRALREARGVTQEGWAAWLGYSRTTVRRWERGDAVPDAQAEAAIVAHCTERGLFRLFDHGPLHGLTLTPDLLRDLLAEARLDTTAGRPHDPAMPVPLAPAVAATPPGATTPTNLPAPLTSFIGREREQAEVRRLLATTRLLTLTGTGGVGKTRLALEVARATLDQYPDGVWLVELAELSDPALVPRAVAVACEVRELPGQPLTETLTRQLASRRLLLVLDDCVHLVAACAELAVILLRACPTLTILTTSREPLGITGETAYRLPSLTVPDAPAPAPEHLTAYESVVLFVERARAVHPAFGVTDANFAAVAEVCRRLDGIPLALELAAARVKLLPVEQIAARLGNRFRLLTGGSRTALPRHQTLRATIDWSYDLLTDRERSLLRRLSVFAGGATLDVVETVCAGDDVESFAVLDLLGQLVDKSLVLAEAQDGEARYRLLETIREYGAEKLGEAGETQVYRTRHRDWCRDLALQAAPKLRERQQQAWLTRLEREHANLRAALAWSIERPDIAGEDGLRLAAALVPFWYMHGHISDGRRWLEQVLSAEQVVPAALRARALNNLAGLALSQGDYTAARVRYEDSLVLYRELGDTAGIARSLSNLGVLEGRLGDRERSRLLQEEGLALYRACGDTAGIVNALNNLGDLAQKHGDLGAAQALFDEALAVARSVGDRWSVAIALMGLGDVAAKQGDPVTARSRLSESLGEAREIGDKLNIAECLARLAGLVASAEPARAVRLFAAAHALREVIGATLEPGRQATVEDGVARARAGLAPDEFAAAWSEGRMMRPEEAIALALANGALS